MYSKETSSPKPSCNPLTGEAGFRFHWWARLSPLLACGEQIQRWPLSSHTGRGIDIGGLRKIREKLRKLRLFKKCSFSEIAGFQKMQFLFLGGDLVHFCWRGLKNNSQIWSICNRDVNFEPLFRFFLQQKKVQKAIFFVIWELICSGNMDFFG